MLARMALGTPGRAGADPGEDSGFFDSLGLGCKVMCTRSSPLMSPALAVFLLIS